MYEVAFLPVGYGERSSDAIALRYTTTGSWADQVVVVIDGGFSDDGQALVEHVQRWRQS